MYYIKQDNRIVLFDKCLTTLKNTLEFMLCLRFSSNFVYHDVAAFAWEFGFDP